jgi:hypothetical protein
MTRRLPGASFVVLMLCCVLSPNEVVAQAVTQSFAELRPQLPSGSTIVIRGETGGTTTARVVGWGDGQLTVSRRGSLLRRAEQLTFAENSVARIELADSTWDGALIGAAVGVGAAALVTIACTSSDSCSRNADSTIYVFAPAAVLGGLGGLGVGGLIDSHVRRTLFERPRPRSGLQVSPFIDHRTRGVAVSLWF